MIFIKRLPNLGELVIPRVQANLFRKTQKEPSQPRTRLSVQKPHSFLICPPGTQGCYQNRSLALHIQALSPASSAHLWGQCCHCLTQSFFPPLGPVVHWSPQLVMQGVAIHRASLVPKAAHYPRASEDSSMYIHAVLSA